MNVEVSWNFNDVPGSRFPIVWQIHVVLVVKEGEGDLVPSEGPGPELHDAGLLVKREVCYVDGAGRLKTKLFEKYRIWHIFIYEN